MTHRRVIPIGAVASKIIAAQDLHVVCPRVRRRCHFRLRRQPRASKHVILSCRYPEQRANVAHDGAWWLALAEVAR